MSIVVFNNDRFPKANFFSHLLTLLITIICLFLSSGLSIVIYVYSTKKSHFQVEDLMRFYGKNLFFLLQLFPFLIALISLLFCVRFIHKQELKSLFTQKSTFDFKRFFLSSLIWGLLLTIVLLIQVFFTNSSIKWNYDSNSFWYLFLISLIFVTIQTLFEEILFRAYLLQSFNQIFQKKWLSILLTALLFGGMHLNNPEIKIFGESIILYYVLTGLFLASVTILDKGIELAFGFHVMNNLFGSIILTNNWQVFQTDALLKDYSDPEVSWEFWIIIFFFYPFLFLVYKKIYKWDFRLIFKNV